LLTINVPLRIGKCTPGWEPLSYAGVGWFQTTPCNVVSSLHKVSYTCFLQNANTLLPAIWDSYSTKCSI